MLNTCLKCCAGTAEGHKGKEGSASVHRSSSNLGGVSAELANRSSGDVGMRGGSNLRGGNQGWNCPRRLWLSLWDGFNRELEMGKEWW